MKTIRFTNVKRHHDKVSVAVAARLAPLHAQFMVVPGNNGTAKTGFHQDLAGLIVFNTALMRAFATEEFVSSFPLVTA